LRLSKRKENKRGRHERRQKGNVRRNLSANCGNVTARGRKNVKESERKPESENERGTERGRRRETAKGIETAKGRETGSEIETEIGAGIGIGTGTEMSVEGDTTMTTPGTNIPRRMIANPRQRPSCQKKRLSGLSRKL
jgi:hypothetical protein